MYKKEIKKLIELGSQDKDKEEGFLERIFRGTKMSGIIAMPDIDKDKNKSKKKKKKKDKDKKGSKKK